MTVAEVHHHFKSREVSELLTCPQERCKPEFVPSPDFLIIDVNLVEQSFLLRQPYWSELGAWYSLERHAAEAKMLM